MDSELGVFLGILGYLLIGVVITFYRAPSNSGLGRVETVIVLLIAIAAWPAYLGKEGGRKD